MKLNGPICIASSQRGRRSVATWIGRAEQAPVVVKPDSGRLSPEGEAAPRPSHQIVATRSELMHGCIVEPILELEVPIPCRVQAWRSQRLLDGPIMVHHEGDDLADDARDQPSTAGAD